MIAICDRVEHLAHYHALLVPTMTKADYNDVILFKFFHFINMLAARKVEKEIDMKARVK